MHQRDEIKLAVFEVLGKLRLGVRDFGLLLTVLGSKFWLGVSSFVHSVGYNAHTRKHAINISTHNFSG
jgi:hypothetical protein